MMVKVQIGLIVIVKTEIGADYEDTDGIDHRSYGKGIDGIDHEDAGWINRNQSHSDHHD